MSWDKPRLEKYLKTQGTDKLKNELKAINQLKKQYGMKDVTLPKAIRAELKQRRTQ